MNVDHLEARGVEMGGRKGTEGGGDWSIGGGGKGGEGKRSMKNFAGTLEGRRHRPK